MVNFNKLRYYSLKTKGGDQKVWLRVNLSFNLILYWKNAEKADIIVFILVISDFALILD